MTKKQTKFVVCVLQGLLLVLLFLPSAKGPGANPSLLNAFDLARKYSDLGLVYDARVYIMLAACGPVVTALSLFLLHGRKNFGVGACVCALTAVVHACFYTSVKSLMTGTVTVTGLYGIMVLLAVAGMMAEIYGYLTSDTAAGKSGGSGREKTAEKEEKR